jgi:hypothetical protein
MHRRSYKQHFPLDCLPAWPCPRKSCKNGVLQVDLATVRKAQAKDSDLEIQGSGYHPEIDWGRYTAILRCAACGEAVCLVARTTYEAYATEDGYDYEQYLHPKYFEPAIPMIAIPPKCPAEVVGMLGEAFALYWTSPGSAANSIRIALERLLDSLSVPRELSKGEKARPLNLHGRIDQYKQTHPETAEYLLAAKWIGNHGSHGEPVKHDVVLDSLEIMERALHYIYPEDYSRVAAMVARINAAKGPI